MSDRELKSAIRYYRKMIDDPDISKWQRDQFSRLLERVMSLEVVRDVA